MSDQATPAVTADGQHATKPSVGRDALSLTLQGRFETWLQSREPQELKFQDAYMDAMRIHRPDDTTGTGTARARKSRLFVGSTRGKIRSARAKIKDSLFGSGKMPFDTSPVNEQLKDYADTVEEIICFQLKDMGFKSMLGGATNALCTYGTSVIFGPFERPKDHVTVGLQPDAASGVPLLAEQRFTYRMPYFEHAATMDVYPDPSAPDTQSGMGVFWSSWSQPAEVRSWKGQRGYNAEAIDYALTQEQNTTTSQGSDRTTDLRANTYRFGKDGRIRVLRYIGQVRADELAIWTGEELAEGADPEEVLEAIVIMAGGVVVKADRSPYKSGFRPALRAVYEEVEHEFWGVGIAENNDPHQRVVNAAFRLFIEGKAFALLKCFSADKSKFLPTEDFKLYPGKQFNMKSGLTPEERKTALIWHDMVDVSEGWENVIAMSEKFSDDDTGITKYTQGNDADHLNKTATGISMIMGAASLPMKEVIQNIDDMWIVKAIEALIDWNMQNLEPETVRVLLGDKHAQTWEEIQQFGKTSFMAWKATGSSTFMMKEILMQKLQGFLQLALASPLTADKVDVRELLEQVWEAGEVGKESPILTDEEIAQRKAQAGPQMPPEVEQALQKQEQLIQSLQQQVQDQAARLRDREASHQLKAAEIASRVHIAAGKGELDDRDSRVDAEAKLANVELTEAQIALVQAQVLATLRSAGVAIPPQLAAAAQTLQVEPVDEDGPDESMTPPPVPAPANPAPDYAPPTPAPAVMPEPGEPAPRSFVHPAGADE